MGDNIGGGTIMLLPITCQCVGNWISTGLPGIYIYRWPYVYWLPPWAKFELLRIFQNVTIA